MHPPWGNSNQHRWRGMAKCRPSPGWIDGKNNIEYHLVSFFCKTVLFGTIYHVHFSVNNWLTWAAHRCFETKSYGQKPRRQHRVCRCECSSSGNATSFFGTLQVAMAIAALLKGRPSGSLSMNELNQVETMEPLTVRKWVGQFHPK